MRDIKKVILIVLVLSLFLAAQATAYMPTQRGLGYPKTVWSDKVKGTVSGRVVTSMDPTKGVEGAYVAIVNTVNPAKEYANATTEADGNFKFTGVNATYSSNLQKGPDGTTGTYQLQGTNAFMIYVNTSSGEGYSNTFGVDTNHTNTLMGNIVIYNGIPNPDDFATPEPTAQPTPVVTAVPPTPTPEPSPTPAPGFPVDRLAAGAVLAIAVLAIVAIAAYFLFMRKK